MPEEVVDFAIMIINREQLQFLRCSVPEILHSVDSTELNASLNCVIGSVWYL